MDEDWFNDSQPEKPRRSGGAGWVIAGALLVPVLMIWLALTGQHNGTASRAPVRTNDGAVSAVGAGNLDVGEAPSQVADNDGASSTSEPAPTRCVSLKVLQARLAQGSRANDLMNLCGLTVIEGVVVDRDLHDVILFGSSKPGPALHLDDLVVALRNASSTAGSPGCSIDPQPETIKLINEAERRAQGVGTLSAQRAAMNKLLRIGCQQQKVRIINVPGNTSFFKVLVDADYLLKRLANGSYRHGVQGFASLSAAAMRANRTAIQNGKPPPCSSIMSRFWFTPEKVEILDHSDVVFLKECKVGLKTEQEYSSKSGELVGANAAEPFAERFVKDFCKRYDDIAVEIPIYHDLRSMFRFVAIAQGIKYHSIFNEAGLDISYLLSRYRVTPVSVPSSVPGISDVMEDTVQVPGGKVHLWLMSVGGVDIRILPNPTICHQPQTKRQENVIQMIEQKVKSQRPSPDACFWDASGIPARYEIRLPRISSVPGQRKWLNLFARFGSIEES